MYLTDTRCHVFDVAGRMHEVASVTVFFWWSLQRGSDEATSLPAGYFRNPGGKGERKLILSKYGFRKAYSFGRRGR
jgi:hypothetical protein